MRGFIISASSLILACSPALAQTTAGNLKFEVASVRPSGSFPRNTAPPLGTISGGPGTSDPGRITYSRVPMRLILAPAFGLQSDQIKGPDWVLDDNSYSAQRYDIVAKVPPGATKEQATVMMQNLLKERFKLSFHIEKKDFDVYQLTVAKGGPKLKDAAKADGPPPPPNAPGPPPLDKEGFRMLPAGRTDMVGVGGGDGHMRMTARMMTTTELLSRLGAQLSANRSSHVVDKTGLTGKYDFRLEYSMAGLPAFAGQPQAPLDSPAPDLPSALEKQLGLKLEKTKAPLDVLVIDTSIKRRSRIKPLELAARRMRVSASRWAASGVSKLVSFATRLSIGERRGKLYATPFCGFFRLI